MIDLSDAYDGAIDEVARVLVQAPGLERITRIVVARASALETLRSRWGERVVAPSWDDEAP
ncbi:MAG: hypothetical protein AB7N76_28710 [Planctomycetota bacterium]